MDFNTRDHYRHVIEKIAKKCNFSEIEVALKSIELAKKGAELNGSSDRTAHVGYYLIGKGLPQLERSYIKTIILYLQFAEKTFFRFPLFFSIWVQLLY